MTEYFSFFPFSQTLDNKKKLNAILLNVKVDETLEYYNYKLPHPIKFSNFIISKGIPNRLHCNYIHFISHENKEAFCVFLK
jgi:hypothetical protein